MASEKPPSLDGAAETPAQTPRPDAEEPKASVTSDANPAEEPETTGSSRPAEDSASTSESGEASSASSPSEKDQATSDNVPPLPNEAPPLPGGIPPGSPVEDDGWDFHWDAAHQAYFFHNRFTGATTWENPRTTSSSASTSQPGAPGTSAPTAPVTQPPLPTSSRPAAGGYNPAIHGDYDPNAWYAKGDAEEDDESASASAAYLAGIGQPEGSTASFNRFTGQFQRPGDNPDRHSDAAKSHRQMNAFFDVDAAANAHDGRSLKAERSGKKISKAELKHFKEKRKARKEEKRRAWLRD